MKRIEIEDKPVFDKYKTPHIINSEYQFTTLFAWADRYNFCFHEFNNTLFVFGNQNNGALQCYFPIGSESYHDSVEYVKNIFKERKMPFNMRPLSKEMLDKIRPFLNGDFTIGTKPSYTDYICDFKTLSEYEGHSYKKKRKSAKSFYNKYDFQYVSLSIENIECAIDGLYEILSDSGQSIDTDEWNAYLKILNNFRALNLRGGMIIINGKVEAISVAESFYDSVIIHIRRCNKSFAGIYPAMLQQLLKNEFTDFDYKYVNLQDDMGIVNLRNTKLSYRPIILLNKYYVYEESAENDCDSN